MNQIVPPLLISLRKIQSATTGLPVQVPETLRHLPSEYRDLIACCVQVFQVDTAADPLAPLDDLLSSARLVIEAHRSSGASIPKWLHLALVGLGHSLRELHDSSHTNR